jgi:hypothetical protein
MSAAAQAPQQTNSPQKQPEPVTTGLNVSTLEVKSAMEEKDDFKSVNSRLWEEHRQLTTPW